MRFFTLLAAFLMLAMAPAAAAQEKTVRLGYFPNLTHAQALIAQNMAAEGQGWFESRVPGVTIEWQPFNAGPSAMESLFAGAVDLSYVGPNPVLNAYVRSKGGVRVVSGAVRGGAGLVVPQASALSEPASFKDKTIATPQLGNTQDIACRSWLTQGGLKVTMTGGDASIIPTANPVILSLFIQGQVDAAWTVEPWLSRLEMEGGGKLIYAEPAETSITTVLSVSEEYAQAEPELVAALAAAHRELTEWIVHNPAEAQKRVADELTKQMHMRQSFPLTLVEHAWPRLVFDNAISRENFQFALEAARDAGFIKGEHDLGKLVESVD
ncbi:MAG: ABC transporter substrate-binding protein [Candidatus Adiutrix sp.]|jgi:NitT/TauT family transport system substrate-binding protein|nr:ABC transporter substrate-binding protein [Candidatus Adiutrix sp.]